MDHGSVYPRRGCHEESTGKLLGAGCPRMSSAGHGAWYFSGSAFSAPSLAVRVTNPAGRDERRHPGTGQLAAVPAGIPRSWLDHGDGRWTGHLFLAR
jgi:hypothetical protein